jgi:non-canonical purine NTP pyrophosphatase (RdgB/HAM1 family)
MLQLLAATSNKHKIDEFRNMLSGLKVKVSMITPDSLENFPETVEDGKTFEENAEKKAREASAFIDMAAFADDSGLMVDALNGEPGIYSARYAGEGASNEQRIAKLLKNLQGVANRKAKFVSVISIAYRGELVKSFRGEIHGTIIEEPRGSHGFGYDPVFVPDGYDKTFAELGADVKDSISHRAIAMRKAADFIKAELASMDDLEFE